MDSDIDKFCDELECFVNSKFGLLNASQIACLLISNGCDILFNLKCPESKESIDLSECRKIIYDSIEAAYQDFLRDQQEEVDDD